MTLAAAVPENCRNRTNAARHGGGGNGRTKRATHDGANVAPPLHSKAQTRRWCAPTPFSNFNLSEEIKFYLEKKPQLSCEIISLEDLNLPLFTPSLEIEIKKKVNCHLLIDTSITIDCYCLAKMILIENFLDENYNLCTRVFFYTTQYV